MQFILSLFSLPEAGVMSRELRALFIHRTLLRIALGATSAFTIVFFYQYFDSSVYAALLSYALMYAIAALLTPIGAFLLRTYGIRSLLITATPLLALGAYNLYLLSLADSALSSLWGVWLYIMLTALYKILYWVPYHVDMTEALKRVGMGRQVAFLTNATDILVVATPFVGGLIVASYGYDAMFAFGIIFVLLAVVPLFWLPQRYESYSWGYVETWKKFFSIQYRPLILSQVGDGVQVGVLAVVWPLMIFLLVSERFEVLGAITTLTFLAILVLRGITGRLFDTWSKERVVFWGAIFSATGWVLKMFVVTPFQIFTVDTYHSFGQVVNRTSVDALLYEQAADNGRYVDEYTALKEMGLNVGRLLALLLAAAAVYFLGVTVGFACAILFAAVSSLLTVFLLRQEI